ncbi:MAG: hypothetical protein R3C28_04275 [Pirellulaceae bacterium]
MSSSLLIASGDFRLHGGMDRPNYELAWHWAERLQRERCTWWRFMLIHRWLRIET